MPIYGSGGFTNYSDDALSAQFGDWVGRDGCREFKMKIRADPPRDPVRMAAARPRSATGRSDLAGAHELWEERGDTCHLNSSCRMGDDPATSVVDADGRSWDVPNPWICDGSVFPTVGGVNPSLTIQAIALRTDDRIAALAKRGEL